MSEKIILVGASSELAQQVSVLLSKKFTVINLSGKPNKSNNINYTEVTYSQTGIENFLKTLSKSDNHIFIFFNGVADSEIFINISVEEINSIINTNLTIPIIFTKTCLKTLFPRKNKFIYLTSSRALKGDRGISMYSATKSALVYFAKSLSYEYSNLNQFFYVISLGIFNAGLKKAVPESSLEKIKKKSAIKGYVDINELVQAISFAIESDASTGSVIYCDNGYF